MYSLFKDSSLIMLGHHCVAILSAKMLIWAPFSHLLRASSFYINPCYYWRYVITMSCTSFRVSPHPKICLNVCSLSESNKCRFTLKLVCDMIITCSQMHHTAKNSLHSSVIWPVWLNGWVFIYKLTGCKFLSCCCHLNCRYGACFEQGVRWHSGKL